MTLYLVGLGLDRRDVSMKALDIIKRCKKVFMDNYTGILMYPKEDLEADLGCDVILADRDFVEKDAEERIIKKAIDADVAFLVVGDPLSATTHSDLILRADELGVKTEIINNISILIAIGQTGLQLYKFGKTSSIVFPEKDWMPETPYNVIKSNMNIGLHTLLLLDIKVKEPKKADIRKGKLAFQDARYMTVAEGIKYLLDIEKKKKGGVFTKDTYCIGCARLGRGDQKIVSGSAGELMKVDMGEPLHCLIVPGDLHFMEEEFLKRFDLRKD